MCRRGDESECQVIMNNEGEREEREEREVCWSIIVGFGGSPFYFSFCFIEVVYAIGNLLCLHATKVAHTRYTLFDSCSIFYFSLLNQRRI